MNLHKQIKEYRQQANISQEELAAKIYVSRQTISNWETGRSYPDIENLLLLSICFDVTLDELVKGDVEEMKQRVKSNEISKLSYVMLIFTILTAILIGLSMKFLGSIGLIIPACFYAVVLIAAFKLEKIKKKQNIKTYAEIVAYYENGNLDVAKAKRNKPKEIARTVMIVVCYTLIFLVIALLFSF